MTPFQLRLPAFIILLLLANFASSSAQSNHEEAKVKEIRQRYNTIQQKLPQLQVGGADYSEFSEEDEHLSSRTDKHEIYYNATDTFLIRYHSGFDEGGPYAQEIEEVYLWNDEPFFYFSKTYSFFSEGNLQETRLYIHDGTIIRKLVKEVTFEYAGSFYENTDTIPNQPAPVGESDMERVKYLVERAR